MSQLLIKCINNCGNLVPPGSPWCEDCLGSWPPDLTYLNLPQGQLMQNSIALQNANFTEPNHGDALSNVFSVPSYPATFRNASWSNTYNEMIPPISPWTSQSPPASSQYPGIFHIPFVSPSTQVNTRQLNLLQPDCQPQTHAATMKQSSQPQDRSRVGTQPASARGDRDLPVAPTVDQKFIPYVPDTNRDRSHVARDTNAGSCIRVFRTHGRVSL